MENMKAVRVHNYGGPEVLRFEIHPARRPVPVNYYKSPLCSR